VWQGLTPQFFDTSVSPQALSHRANFAESLIERKLNDRARANCSDLERSVHILRYVRKIGPKSILSSIYGDKRGRHRRIVNP
jgi:hypothetical protein